MLYSNFNHTIQYTPKAEREELRPSVFYLQSLSYKTFTSLYALDALPDGCTHVEFHDKILQECIVHADGLPEDFYINGKLKSIKWTSVLPLDIQQELIDIIRNLFMPSKDFYSTLSLTLELAINPKYSGESWDCTKCQARGLHKQRNCYLIPQYDHEDSISYQVLNEIHTECPIYKKDVKLLDAAFHAKNYSELGFLPEEGSLGNQTVFFVVVSQKINNVITYYQNKRAEEQSSKRK